MNVLVLGATGMLGNAVFRVLRAAPGLDVTGTTRGGLRADLCAGHFGEPGALLRVDVEGFDALTRLFEQVRPDVVINCVGLVKQLDASRDPLVALPLNAMLPHRLASLCGLCGARLIHFSTDCVFSGSKGHYVESDQPDCTDLYGMSKLIGEVDAPHVLTLRTSIIGHELGSAHGLLEWFLAAKGPVRGFARAIFSGLPTVEVARVLRDFVLPRSDIHGLRHLSAAPISKYELLRLVATEYRRDTPIERDDDFAIDRSLDSSRFRAETGYTPPQWPDLIHAMHQFGQD